MSLLVLILVWFIPIVSSADPTCTGITSDVTATDRSTATIAYTKPAGSNQTLTVGISTRDGNDDTVSTVTYAGASMTEKIEHNHTGGSGDTASTIYFLKNPASGTNNVVVTWTDVVLSSGVFIMTCTNVHSDADPFRNAGVFAEGGSPTPSVTATDASGDLTIDVMTHDGETTAPTVGANQTVIVAASPGSEFSMGASYQSGGLGGVMSWTTVSFSDWVSVAVSLREATSAGTFLYRRRDQ